MSDAPQRRRLKARAALAYLRALCLTGKEPHPAVTVLVPPVRRALIGIVGHTVRWMIEAMKT